MTKVPLYIPEALNGAPLAPWFTPVSKEQLFTASLPQNFFETSVEKVLDPAGAQAIVLPNNFKSADLAIHEYIRPYADIGEKLGIPVFVFSIGDFTDLVRFDPRVYVFRFSAYRSTMQLRDIVIPTSTEDPPTELLYIREKQTTPVVAFCGMGAFTSYRAWVKYFLKNIFYSAQGIFRPATRARKLGVYWRRAMMRSCGRSSLVATHFIIRRTFSGLRKTIELDPKVARKEYLEATAHADFVLAPKGDGNYSNRFLKTLAFGRIPVFVDTDVVLPLEGVVEYSKIVVRVPMNAVTKTPQLIREFYDAVSAEEWKARQQLARNIFERYLRQDQFFSYFFEQVLPTLKDNH